MQDVPLKIHSHPRSGTHLLAGSIYEYFELSDPASFSSIREGKKFVIGDKEWVYGDRLHIPWGKILTNHNFYNPQWIRDPKKVLYIVRHPIQSMISYWRIMDPKCEGDFEAYFGHGRMKFWKRHVTGYVENCHWVRYEDLVSKKFDETMDKIQHWFGLTPKESTWSRLKYHVGWYSVDEPIQDKLPTPEITERFKQFFPDGYLGYDMDALGVYNEDISA